MTILYAYDQTDLNSVNFNFWYSYLDHDELNRDANLDGYEDNYHLLTTTNDALSLYGYDFGFNKDGEMVKGTIQDVSQWAWDVDLQLWVERWHWAGWNIDSQDLFDVGQTASIDDDFALLSSILSDNDTFYLSDFDDEMRGFGGRDSMYGFAGDDVLVGDNGNDRLNGGSGDDILSGGSGRDYLFGGDNNDILNGGNQNDVLRGGNGKDVGIGGGGADIFIFDTGDDKFIIRDFDAVGAVHDVLDLSGTIPIVGWKDLRINHMTQDGGDVVIDALFGELIVLRGVALSDLDRDDFVF